MSFIDVLTGVTLAGKMATTEHSIQGQECMVMADPTVQDALGWISMYNRRSERELGSIAGDGCLAC